MSVPNDMIKVRLEEEVRAFIHNDVGNAAHFLIKRIGGKIAAVERDGLFLDQMTCALMIGFSHELQRYAHASGRP
ncbi:MAG TPA: hypothetical protein VN155_02305 [Devosia sp.]|nr:hypothetical protein [Devosia sp.]